MGLVLGAFEVAVFLVMELAKREEWNPRPLVMANPMNEQEGRSNPSMNFSGNCIHHSGRVDDSINTEGASHLFLGKVGTSHMHHDLPMGFNQTIRRLTLGWRGNHLRRVVDKIVADGPTKEFRITVAVEATSQGSSRRTEQTKSREDALGRKSFQTEGPIIPGCAIDQNESTAITPHRDAVTESNIHVDGIKKTVGGPIKRSILLCLWNSSKRAQRHRKFAAINPFTVTANIQNMFIVKELPTTHDAVNLFRRPMGLSVEGIGRVARANIRERSVGVVKEATDLLR